ncbi:MAG: response regulator [Timaviella obliquedivisa GSE-PSE-MK23-08B]|jgi:CheY-like chemotaxis protein|nr:response regulator [Timaviella obliquedivisa GSE-PSE-MK23-08B]
MESWLLDLENNRSSILVVDDIYDNCFLIQSFLEAEGYEVDTAESGVEAIAKIELNLPTLVLLDVMMPDMNGYEVVENIRQNLHLPNLPILFVTGMDISAIPNAEKTHVNGVIHKPVDLEQLLEKVQSFAQPT